MEQLAATILTLMRFLNDDRDRIRVRLSAYRDLASIDKTQAHNDAFTKAHFNFDNLFYLTSPRRQLNLHRVAIGLIQLPPDEGYTFTPSHAEQEEVYIVLEGKGLMVINGGLVSLECGDLVRVSPSARRALKASEDTSLFVICAGGVAF